MNCNLPHTEPSGRFNLHCLECCIRLVKSTKPRKDLAKVMLDVIERNGGPSRADIFEGVK
ncbi:MAG: hypothetical protein ACYC0Z_13215 [Acidobacteriaceae bacterium]